MVLKNPKLILLIKAIRNLRVFMSLIKIKNLIFTSNCTNKRIVTVTIKDDGYGFFALLQLVTPYPQNTEKVKCICVSNSNLYFSTDSFVIMKPLDQNEDLRIVIDFAAACIITYKSNTVFFVSEKHRIYY